jgi:hypothetical protein
MIAACVSKLDSLLDQKRSQHLLVRFKGGQNSLLESREIFDG